MRTYRFTHAYIQLRYTRIILLLTFSLSCVLYMSQHIFTFAKRFILQSPSYGFVMIDDLENGYIKFIKFPKCIIINFILLILILINYNLLKS